MLAREEKNIFWQRLDAPGWEHLHLLSEKNGTAADGLVVSVENGQVFRLRYQVHCDFLWRCLRAELALLGNDPRMLILKKQPDAEWIGNGKAIEGSAQCIDIDIAATPFTNTLPIRRLGLRAGQSAPISALYIQVPAMAVSVVSQTYRCLKKSKTQSTYIYQGLDRRKYRVTVDADGLVLDYEGIFKRT